VYLSGTGDEREVWAQVNPKKSTKKKVLTPAQKLGEILSRVAERLDPPPEGVVIGGRSRAAHRVAVLAVASTPGHVLSFLVTKKKKLKKLSNRTGAALFVRPDVFESGHVLSGWVARGAGYAQRTVVMTASRNQFFSNTLESGNRGALEGLEVLNIQGIAVDRESAEDMANWLRDQDPEHADRLAAAIKASPKVRFSLQPKPGEIGLGGLPSHERKVLAAHLKQLALKSIRDAVAAGIAFIEKRRAAAKKGG
jgi:hypothetical protein